jgi:hypothetical protein|tara:strand:- start:845 stop:1117 length:273 start_codon:yes stop_codon:yes gene_type:complete
MLILSIILGILVVTLGYTTINLLIKIEKTEDILISHNTFITKMQEHISHSEKKLKNIDSKGTFEGDDEIGWFFNEIKILQNDLSQFKTNS